MKCWDIGTEMFVDMPAEMEAMVNELYDVCQKHGFTIIWDRWDEMVVIPYNEERHREWLRGINKNF